MYTILWTTAEGSDRWDRCESRREVVALLIREGLEDDEDVLIFTPEADENTIDTESLFASL